MTKKVSIKEKILFHFKTVFIFTPSERRANIVIALICSALMIALFVIYFLPSGNSKLDPEIIAEINALNWQPDTSFESKRYFVQKYDSGFVNDNKFENNPDTKIELETFNPNLIDASQWQQLGLSAKQASVIVNYVAKGGQFRTKEDLKKMFVITPLFYNKVEPYISIPPKEKIAFVNKDTTPYKPANNNAAPKIYTTVEINIATESEFEALPGIGPAIAKGIVAYRNKLRGFNNVEQLFEVYFFTDSIFQLNKSRLKCGSGYIRKININTAELEDLKHPYIEKYVARVLLAYRKTHGNFTDKKQIMSIGVVSNELYTKIEPYLDIK